MSPDPHRHKNLEFESLTTEQHLASSSDIDRLDALGVVRLMNAEDQGVAPAVSRQLESIAAAVERVVHSLRSGGRLIYVGAGTSGRLGVLDASECPPTFQTEPEQVVGVIAGGEAALRRSIEGAEDVEQDGADALRRLDVNDRDTVVGIASSGRTPYVLGAVQYAREVGAAAIGVCCNRWTPLHAACDVTIAPVVGPELISGSTRLKAGTATKMVLNMISTASMVMLGKTYGNRMVDLTPVNEKLRERSLRMACELTGLDRVAAANLLTRCDGELKTALASHWLAVTPDAARERLAQSEGRLRDVVERS